VGGGGQHGCYNALDYRKIKHANAGLLGTYPILSVLPAKFARFLFEFHSGRFESLDLPILPDDRSQFDVHCALEDEQSSLGTGCADSSNSKPVSFTGRASISSSIVREHDILGEFVYIDSSVCVHRQLPPSTFNRNIDLLT
jgi:hypothetical protein